MIYSDLIEKKNLFEARLKEIEEKFSSILNELEKTEYGAGKIKYHIVSTEQNLSDNMFRFTISLNSTSTLPDFIKVEIQNAIDEIFKST